MTDVNFAEGTVGRLAYIRRGSGDPLLLIMGVAGHHGIWREAFLDRLAEDFDVVAHDHRGIGESARADQPFTIADLAADATAIQDHLGWESSHVMGISMGGTVAQELTLSQPDRVRRLVLGCTWAGPGPDGSGVWGPSVGKLAESEPGGDPIEAARRMYEANISPEFAADPREFDEFAATAAAAKVPAPVILMQMQAAAAFDSRDRLDSLAAPTMVVHGTADEVILSAAGERLAGLIDGSRLELLDGVGHLFHWEKPDRTADLVSQHLAG